MGDTGVSLIAAPIIRFLAKRSVHYRTEGEKTESTATLKRTDPNTHFVQVRHGRQSGCEFAQGSEKDHLGLAPMSKRSYSFLTTA